MTEIVDFLNNVTTKNFVEAEKQFSELLNDKLAVRLDAEKGRVANKIFNSDDAEAYDDEEQESEEVADEDV